MLEKEEIPQYDDAGKVVSVTCKYRNAVFTVFEDDLYAELYNAYCHDSGEQISDEGARSFREEVLKRNSQSSDVIILYSMRLGINSIISLANSVICRRLVKLNIADNAVSDYGMHHIRSILESTQLEYLNLASNMISGDGLETIAEAISNHKTIRVLDVSASQLGIHKGSMRKNSLGVNGAMWISNFLLKNTSIETLILEDNDVGSSGGECIGLALTQCTQLKHLTVSENELNTEGAVHILRNAGQLESLDLSKNYIKSEAGVVIDRLLSKPRSQQNLKKLCLEYNELLHAGAQHIAKGLRANTTLEVLNLKGNVLGDDGVAYVVNALQTNSTLLDLNMALNEIGPIGASEIAHVLPYTSLKKLNLRKNFLGDEASAVFSEVLANVEGQCKLQTLDMSSCRIGDDGIVQFFAAITGNKFLKGVDFRDNFVSERAELSLLEYLDANSSLQKVQLAGNRLSHSCLKKIKKICERNRKEFEDAEPNRLKNETYRLKYEQTKLNEAREKLSRQIGVSPT